MNFPDYDALETSSVTSISSAYSSKSESSVMSPPCGSVTELSDHGFCEDDAVSQRKTKVIKKMANVVGVDEFGLLKCIVSPVTSIFIVFESYWT